MNYLIQDTTLIGIADAVREKNGTTEPIMVSELATAITNLPSGGGEVEPIVLSGDCSYGCGGPLNATYIEMFGDTVTTENINKATYMFKNSPLKEIPFDLNFDPKSNTTMSYMFGGCYNLLSVPPMNNCKPDSINFLFSTLNNVREIPETLFDSWDWSYFDGATSAYFGQQQGIFSYCTSLREVPMTIFQHGNPAVTNGYSIYNSAFNTCYVLDEIIDIPFPHYNVAWTSNAFVDTFSDCARLSNITFALQDNGTPYVMNWKNQTIDLTDEVGYIASYLRTRITTDYNSGITTDKEVKDDATYQALKNDPDWFTCNANYSRYNHDSAVNTINSLPDCSASGTNTIKFKGTAGSLTDGGAINTLTEEEIAVATAKGWTVTLS